MASTPRKSPSGDGGAGKRHVARTAFIAGNTKLLPQPQQRAKNTHKRIMPCRLVQRLVGSCCVHYFNATDLSAKSLSVATVRPAVGPARTSAGRDGRRTPHPRGRLASAILSRSLSTLDQEPENQLAELRRYTEARGWTSVEYVDRGVSGSKERRPALDQLLKDARKRKFDVVVCWSLDRMGRSLKHLVVLLDDLHALGVRFVSVREGLDWTTPTGRLQAQLLAMIAEFERSRIQERVKAGLQRARLQGRRLGRPRVTPLPMGVPAGISVRQAAKSWGVSKSTAARRLTAGQWPANATP